MRNTPVCWVGRRDIIRIYYFSWVSVYIPESHFVHVNKTIFLNIQTWRMWDGSTCMFPAKSENPSPILRTHSLERAITHYLFCDITEALSCMSVHTQVHAPAHAHTYIHMLICTQYSFSNLDLLFIYECFASLHGCVPQCSCEPST